MDEALVDTTFDEPRTCIDAEVHDSDFNRIQFYGELSQSTDTMQSEEECQSGKTPNSIGATRSCIKVQEVNSNSNVGGNDRRQLTPPSETIDVGVLGNFFCAFDEKFDDWDNQSQSGLNVIDLDLNSSKPDSIEAISTVSVPPKTHTENISETLLSSTTNTERISTAKDATHPISLWSLSSWLTFIFTCECFHTQHRNDSATGISHSLDNITPGAEDNLHSSEVMNEGTTESSEKSASNASISTSTSQCNDTGSPGRPSGLDQSEERAKSSSGIDNNNLHTSEVMKEGTTASSEKSSSNAWTSSSISQGNDTGSPVHPPGFDQSEECVQSPSGLDDNNTWGGTPESPWGGAALDPSFWGKDDTSWVVRGASYLEDSVKKSAGPPHFTLRCCDLVSALDPFELHHVLARKNFRIHHLRASGDDSFVLAINILCPSTPPTSFVAYFTLDDADVFFSHKSSFGQLSRKFFTPGVAADAFRSKRLKLIPRVVKGPWIVRKVVGVKPALVGTKLKQSYFFGDNYLEILVDVGSSAIATATVGLCIEYANELIVDMAFVIEGDDRNELPEELLAGVRWKQASFASAKKMSKCI